MIVYLRKSLAYIKTDSLQQALKLFIQQTLNVIVLWLGANLVISNQLSIGQLMTFNALLSYFVNPLQNIINLQPKLKVNLKIEKLFMMSLNFKEILYFKMLTIAMDMVKIFWIRLI